METEYKIALLNDDNIHDLIPIYKSAVDDAVDEQYFIKKFNTAYTGHKNIGFIAYAPGGEPAAFYGVLPSCLDYEGEKILVAQSGNTMTHQNHRRKKLFLILALKTYEYCREIGIELIFGFPNEFSYPGFVRKLDWTHEENIQTYLTKCPCIPMLRLKKMLKRNGDWHQNIAHQFLNKLPQGTYPFRSIQDDGNCFTMDRNKAFFEYKTYHQKYILKAAGKSIWVKANGMYLLVGDVEYCTAKEFKKIIQQLHRWCFWMGIPHLRFHVSPNSNLERLLIQVGAKKFDRSYPIGYLNLGDKKIDMQKVKFTLADYDTF